MSEGAPSDEGALPESTEAETDSEEKSKPAAPTSKKRKKPRAEPNEEAEPDEKPQAWEGPDYPAFARSFPRDPELDELVRTFEGGNFAEVRRRAPKLIQSTADASVRRAAKELVERTKPDPIATYLLGAAVALLVILSMWYWTHAHV